MIEYLKTKKSYFYKLKKKDIIKIDIIKKIKQRKQGKIKK